MLMKSGKIINHILDYYAAASQKINLKTVPRSADKARFVFTLQLYLLSLSVPLSGASSTDEVISTNHGSTCRERE